MENELARLRVIYKDSYPDVVRLKNKLQELNADKYPRSLTNSLQGEILLLERELAKLENEKVNMETNITYLRSVLGMSDSLSDGGSAQRAISRNKCETDIALSNARLVNNQHDLESRRRELEGLRQKIDDAANQSSSLLSRLSAAIDNALGTPETRHAIVVEFDARDKSSSRPKRNACPDPNIHGARIRHRVRAPAETLPSEPNVLLSLLTNATGGREFQAAAWAEVPQIERKIEIEIQNEYTATYLPSNRSAATRAIGLKYEWPRRGPSELHAYTETRLLRNFPVTATAAAQVASHALLGAVSRFFQHFRSQRA